MLSGEWRKAQEKGENQLSEPPDDRDFLRAVARRAARSSKGRVLQPRINDVFPRKTQVRSFSRSTPSRGRKVVVPGGVDSTLTSTGPLSLKGLMWGRRSIARRAFSAIKAHAAWCESINAAVRLTPVFTSAHSDSGTSSCNSRHAAVSPESMIVGTLK